MPVLNPALDLLGLAAPALGPWFNDAAITLPPCNDDLAVELTFPTTVIEWRPPIAGLLSLIVATEQRPPDLAPLRKADGSPAFAIGSIVALFRLLPEAEQRIHSLMTVIPRIDGVTGAPPAPSRARVRSFAMELGIFPDLINLRPMIRPTIPVEITEDAEQAAYLGLEIDTDNRLINGPSPMRDLKRPGQIGAPPGHETLLSFASNATAKLWAFDPLGRPIDPGAVAAWWEFLAREFSQPPVPPATIPTTLWAPGLDVPDQRTAEVDDQLVIHLVNAHEGRLGSAATTRLAGLEALTGSGVVRRLDATAPVGPVIGFRPPPTPPAADDMPIPRVAALPVGAYAAIARPWPDGAVDPELTRDFVRIAALDVEDHLIGQVRTGGDGLGGDPADDQNRPSTRTVAAPTARPALLATSDEVAAALAAVFAGDGATQLVTPVAERDAAPLLAPALPAARAPATLPDIAATALVGGGTALGDTVADQKVLLELAFDRTIDGAPEPDLTGAAVRIWPNGFDLEEGRHFRLDGGAGRVRADRTVAIVATLPTGQIAAEAPLGADVMIVTAAGAKFYPDRRFARPAPVGGAPIALAGAPAPLVVCEAGVSAASAAGLADQVPPGATVVSRPSGGPAALIDRTTLPASVLSPFALARTLAAGDAVALTPPAFAAEPGGDTVDALAATGATVTRLHRTGLTRVGEAGAPLPTLERLEVVAARVGAADAVAVIGSTPLLGRYHEHLPHQIGNPGAPGAIELHGTGARLVGPAAVVAAEIARDRVAGSTPSLVEAAATAFPALPPPIGPAVWAAPLRTVASGVLAEPGLGEMVVSFSTIYPFGGALQDVLDWLTARGIPVVAPVVNDAQSIARALDRRLMAAGRGAQEGVRSAIAAIQRAEDFIYLETPALDVHEFGDVGDELAESWWPLNEIKVRLDEVPSLRLILCTSLHAAPGTPPVLERVRNQALVDALIELFGSPFSEGPARSDRIAVFAPSAGPGRSLRLASTTVIVDDAYALTGTTHLWRRGLSFDSSLAVAAFDELLDDGRPSEIRRFRRSLIAGRLGLPVSALPDHPVELVDALHRLHGGDPVGRLVVDPLRIDDDPPAASTVAAWNPDGTRASGFDPVAWLAGIVAEVQSDLLTDAPPTP